MKTKMMVSIIGIAVLAFIAFGFYKASGLQSIQIVKSVTVKSSKQEAFDMVRYLYNFPKWSPFLAQDPTQKIEIKGKDGEEGAQYLWIGNEGKDVGFQEIVKVDTLNAIAMKCDIQKPFMAKPTFDYTFKETANGIEITQDFKLQSDFVTAFFMMVLGVKNKMETTNKQGLGLLKKAIEK